ncbi:MAG: Gfo/Idh/MocA family oxidoreductase [Thermoflavifilum sp.]|nr:Gfo/Idh/MocA family oxidoreductase [Thermoflavifilum sp.]
MREIITPDQGSEPIPTALLGFGLSGKCFHAPFLRTHSQFRVIEVMQRHGEDSLQWFPEAKLYRDPETLIHESRAELIIITTPNHTHFALAKAALHAGKHVVLEKPVTLHSHEMWELMQLAQAHRLHLVPFHNRRFDSGFRTVQHIVATQRLMHLTEVAFHFDRWRPQPRTHWREQSLPGSGILYDLGPHLIDHALCLFGTPQRVMAIIRQLRPGAVTDDEMMIWLDYGDLLASLHASMLVCDNPPRYLLRGTGGAFVKWSEDPQEALLRRGMLPNDPHWGMETEQAWGLLYAADAQPTPFPSLRGDYGMFYQQLYDCLRHQTHPPVTAIDGYRNIRIIELAQNSQQQARWITYTEDNELVSLERK